MNRNEWRSIEIIQPEREMLVDHGSGSHNLQIEAWQNLTTP